MQHDAFEWWAYIWIPSLLGIATVLVSVVALVASSRATRIAHEVERQRELAAAERSADARQQRLLDMSTAEARALRRYAAEALRIREESPTSPGDDRAQKAELDARVLLEQSLVPGAQEILDLTFFDLQHLRDNLPETDTDDELSFESVDLIEERAHRMYERIREWGLSPESLTPMLQEELERALNDPIEYLSVDDH